MKNKIKWQFFATIFLFSLLNLHSEENKKFEYFIKKLYQDRLEAINDPVLAIELLNPSITYNSTKLPNSFGLQIDYGFSRESTEFYYEDFFYHSHEFAYGGNISSKIYPNNDDSRILDSWRFGMGWQNGYGYNFNKFKVYLIHRGTFDWTNLKLNFPTNEANMNKLEGNLRFGTSFASGIMISIAEPFNLGFYYEKSQIQPRYTFLNQIVSWGLENALQRAPDIFEEELVKEFQNYYPILYFIYKSSVSYLLYELRENNMNFPINSSNPLVIESFKVDLRFIF